ncbi:gastrula zinc finger protein XlCGF26.1-like [Onthophagus taurus]|uniref:gastrula zinc finger protein XlCGF26.1-like n=1 Tax=Onthophagus taurus TaxID=166361 RepID=UPI0039BE0489
MTACRGCMGKNERMESVFGAVQEYNITLSEMFTDCTSLGVTKNDGLPEYLCDICVNKVQEWFEFKQMCLKSDETFREDLAKNFVNEIQVDLTWSESGGDSIEFEVETEQEEEVKKRKLQSGKEKGKKKMARSNNSKKEINVNENDEKVDDDDNVNDENPISDHTYASVDKSPTTNYYHCRSCLKIFTDLKVLQNHISSDHPTVLQCKFCNQEFSEHLDFVLHLSICNKTNNEESKLLDQNELKQSEPEKQKIIKKPKRPKKSTVYSHMCHICGRCFANPHSLKTHCIIHTGVKNWVCELCGKRYTTLYSLNCHMCTHEEVKLKHQCTYCPRTFHGKVELENHLRIHTGERPFKCPICSKAFRLKSTMKTHYERHACENDKGIRRYTCSNCNKSFISDISLQRHVESKCHRNDQKESKDHDKESGEETTFPCHICKKEFRSERNLKSHLLRHTANRPFVCTVCYRNFREEATLEAHLRFHARPKPFQCEICDKRFVDRSALRCHNRTHTGEKPFECEVCTKRFSAKMSLKAHMRSHTGEKPFKCSLCNRSFTQRCSYQTHILTIHNGQV